MDRTGFFPQACHSRNQSASLPWPVPFFAWVPEGVHSHGCTGRITGSCRATSEPCRGCLHAPGPRGSVWSGGGGGARPQPAQSGERGLGQTVEGLIAGRSCSKPQLCLPVNKLFITPLTESPRSPSPTHTRSCTTCKRGKGRAAEGLASPGRGPLEA